MAQVKTVESDMLHIQNQLKAALHNHQVLQLKLKIDCENADVKQELTDLQRYIMTLGASQRRLMKIMRMKNAIRNKADNGDKEVVRKRKSCEEEVKDVIQMEKCCPPESEKEVKAKPHEPDLNLLEALKKASDLEVESIAASIDRKFGIPLQSNKIDLKDTFMACIELVTLVRAREVLEIVHQYKVNYALEHPLLEIPKPDASQRRRNETYLSCTPKKKPRREPSSDKEVQCVVVDENVADGDASSEDLPDGPDQPFTEHQLCSSQESVSSKKDDFMEESLSS